MGPRPTYVRRGSLWVESSDGRSVKRTGRDTFVYVEHGRRYTVDCEPGGSYGVGIFRGARADDGTWAGELWPRVRELLQISGDPYDTYPDDAVDLSIAERWRDLNPYEGVLCLQSTDPTLLPAPVTYARHLAPDPAWWSTITPETSALVFLELELSEPIEILDPYAPPDPYAPHTPPVLPGATGSPAAPGLAPSDTRLTITGSIANTSPVRLRRDDGYVLAVDIGPHRLPLGSSAQHVRLTGHLSIDDLRLVAPLPPGPATLPP